MTQGTNQGMQTSISKSNQMRGKWWQQLKKETFTEVIEWVKPMKEPVHVATLRYCNQDIA